MSQPTSWAEVMANSYFFLGADVRTSSFFFRASMSYIVEPICPAFLVVGFSVISTTASYKTNAPYSS